GFPRPSSDPPPGCPPPAGLLPTPPSNPRFRHLSEVEMAERREKGLCFNCDQKWSRQHNCCGRLFLFVADTDGVCPSELDLESLIAEDTPSDSDTPVQAQ
ncbi:transposon Ty3-I gag-pol polyprotein, partial [Trifolium medium]|nr:transposon Ty3-I gag-pol polyprotein [Trifolium medium]